MMMGISSSLCSVLPPRKLQDGSISILTAIENSLTILSPLMV
jgi:hypothetical protein